AVSIHTISPSGWTCRSKERSGEVFSRQDEIGAEEFGNAIRGPLGIHRADVHRYWFEDAPSNLDDQLRYLRSVKRLTAKELEIFTEGLSIPESACSACL